MGHASSISFFLNFYRNVERLKEWKYPNKSRYVNLLNVFMLLWTGFNIKLIFSLNSTVYQSTFSLYKYCNKNKWLTSTESPRRGSSEVNYKKIFIRHVFEILIMSVSMSFEHIFVYYLVGCKFLINIEKACRYIFMYINTNAYYFFSLFW